jgi:hypothetical protein
MRKTRRQGNVGAMSNPYGIALNRAWTEWASECAVSETTAAALHLLSENRRADEVVAKLKPSEVKLVIDTVQRWPECFPPRALAALEAARSAPAPEPFDRSDRPAHARRPTRPSAAPGSAREHRADLGARTRMEPPGRKFPPPRGCGVAIVSKPSGMSPDQGRCQRLPPVAPRQRCMSSASSCT